MGAVDCILQGFDIRQPKAMPATALQVSRALPTVEGTEDFSFGSFAIADRSVMRDLILEILGSKFYSDKLRREKSEAAKGIRSQEEIW